MNGKHTGECVYIKYALIFHICIIKMIVLYDLNLFVCLFGVMINNVCRTCAHCEETNLCAKMFCMNAH